MSPSFNPEKLDVSKAEVLEYLRVIYIRMKNNPKVSRKVRGKFAADLKLIEWFESEEDLKYHLCLAMEIADGIRSIIERKTGMTGEITPQMQALNKLNKASFLDNLAIAPEVTQESDKKKIIAEVRAALGYGGMPG